MHDLPPQPPTREDLAPAPPPPPPPSPAGGQKYRGPAMSQVANLRLTWQWWEVLPTFLLYLVISLLGGVALGAVSAVMNSGEVDAETLAMNPWLILMSTAGLLLATVIYVAARSGQHTPLQAIQALMGPTPPRWEHIWKGVGYGLLAYVIFQIGFGALITSLIELSGGELPEVQTEINDALHGGGMSTALTLLSISVLAPIGEEMFYRGMLYQPLANRMTGWAAAGISGLAFGVTHLEPIVVLVTFPLGMFLAFIFRREGSLVVPILAHVVFNSITGMLLLFVEV